MKNGNSGFGELMKELWEAAVALRGTIEPADYKRYVLPIIFLRFLSLRYEKRRAELIAYVREGRAGYDVGIENLDTILSNPDEYRAGGAFSVPDDARWDSILANAQRDDIKSYLDDVLQLVEDRYPDKLRGLLPRIYAGSNLSPDNVRGLINIFSRDVFRQDHGGEDLIGRVYEYFIGEFANSEGKRGGEYFTPISIVKTLVAMLEPTEGIVFDPCCGSGGMFVQSDTFTKHSHRLSFLGQESKDFTYRLCRMNLFIHGIDGDIRLGNSYTGDQHAGLQADYIIANPPFNDGAKSREGWGADKVPDKDPRLTLGNNKLPLSPRNANTMWMLHFLYHLKDTGTAGFVMATGELSASEIARLEVRKALIEADVVDCIVQLPGQLFANTGIPSALWLLSKNRNGAGGYRKRAGEVLFIDARKMGTLIPGSRKQKQFTDEEIDRISSVYCHFKRKVEPKELLGFCHVANTDDIRQHRYTLTPGRHVGSTEVEAEDEPFEERFPRLMATLLGQIPSTSDTVLHPAGRSVAVQGRARSPKAFPIKTLSERLLERPTSGYILHTEADGQEAQHESQNLPHVGQPLA
jgi:type I restriction enzyme M protein